MEKETVNFVLRTTDINASLTFGDYNNQTIQTDAGTIAQNRTSLTWNKINLKQILGSMYDKYEKFNIYLNAVASSASGTTAETDLDKRIFQVVVSGLPFINTNNATMGIIKLNNAASTTNVDNTLNTIPFTINKTPMASIKIDLLILSTNGYYAPIAPAYLIGHTLYSFSIVGIDEYKNVEAPSDIDLTVNRLEIGK